MLRVDNLPSPHPLQSDFTHPNPHVLTAYAICRLAERAIDPIQDRPPHHDESVRTKLINVHILGHLLSQSRFLSHTAISEVARAIRVSCRRATPRTDDDDTEELNKLGEFYKNHLLPPFCKFTRRTSGHEDGSWPLFPSSFRFGELEVDQMLAETPKSYSTLRKLAMQREDYRCIATRILDYAYALGLRTPNGGMYDGDVDSLEVCRIFPSSLNADLEQSEKTRDSCANVWRVLNSLGYTDIFSCFATANKIHSLENIMVVTKSLLYRFDRLKTWFEPVDGIPNCYQICSILKPPRGLINGQWVTFQSSDPRLPLPNCEFLRIHAVCCRVAHQSGASDLFYELERDLESNPNPTMEVADFAKVLHVHLESLSDSSTHVDAD